MKILMISAGLSPKRIGGVPLYVRSLRDELARRGHEIVYLATDSADSRRRPGITQTNQSAPEYLLISPGNRLPWELMPRPLSDIHASRQTKDCLATFVDQVKPDVIHFHEILCFPLELVSFLRSRGFKQIFTTQDYSSICPTIQLYRHDRQLCTLRADELQCHLCVSRWRHPSLRPATDWLIRSIAGTGPDGRLVRGALRRVGGVLDRLIAPFIYRPSLYRKRRIESVKHLQSFNLILCMSQLQRQLISNIVGDSVPIRHVYLSLPTYGSRALDGRPEDTTRPATPIRFGALNVDQEVKGRQLLLDEFSSLHHLNSHVELHMFGHMKGSDRAGVTYHGPYQSSDLDNILSTIDVGIIPSIWPEAYGYVGPEMLTRGVPLIVSSAGAMTEYVIPYVNGLHFDPSKRGALQDAMDQLASDPQLLGSLKANAPSSRQGIMEFREHVDVMEEIYGNMLSGASGSSDMP